MNEDTQEKVQMVFGNGGREVRDVSRGLKATPGLRLV